MINEAGTYENKHLTDAVRKLTIALVVMTLLAGTAFVYIALFTEPKSDASPHVVRVGGSSPFNK